MMHHKLHQTVFHVEKLKNIVGISGSSAYHIMTSQGDCLGTVGNLSEIINDTSGLPAAANKNAFDSLLHRDVGHLFGQIRTRLAR